MQAVNGVGLVGIDDNQGSYFVPGVIPGEEAGDLQPTALTLSTPVPTAGDYGANVTVRATLRNDAGAAAGAAGRDLRDRRHLAYGLHRQHRAWPPPPSR